MKPIGQLVASGVILFVLYKIARIIEFYITYGSLPFGGF